MRQILFISLLVFPFLSFYSQTGTENYVLSRTYKTAVATPATTFSTTLHLDEITYFDGLGRPMQHIGVKQAGGLSYEDIVTYIGYDQYGREDKKYLPYPDATGTGGFFKTGDIAGKTETYYYNNFTTDFPGLTASTSNPFSETRFEASPLNRTLEQGAPGKDWKVNPTSDADHTVKFGYSTNVGSSGAGKVRMFKVTLSTTYSPTLTNPSPYYYPAGALYKTVTKDENWTLGLNNTTEEFKDKQGRVVLKRTYANTDLNNDGDTTDTNEQQVPHDTYYVYDSYGNLTYVIPPKADGTTTTVAGNTTKLNELCYQYKYDDRNRLVEKKVPGKGWEYMVYNKLDQPVLTQDQVLKASGKWLLTKYDALGRVAYTGYVSSGNTRGQYQAIVDTGATQYESRRSALSFGGTSVYYTKDAQPITATEIYTINYYDDYNVNIGFVIPSSGTFGESIASGTATKGLPTVTKVKVLGTSSWITTAMGYDEKGRVIWTKTTNPYLGTTDIVETKLDFMGNIEESKTTHQKTGKGDLVVRDYFTYDHVNRLKTHTQTINGSGPEMIADNSYDKLGQLIGKGVGNAASSSRLQEVAYGYNVRGWLKSINDVGNTNKLFNFKIAYNDPSSGAALFNGNISRVDWRTDNTDSGLKNYRYYYDDLNRITSATANSTNYNLSGITYDKNGNILALTRKGAINPGATSFGTMDLLSYGYNSSSNKLKTVNDSGNDTYGFKDGSSATTQYSYDLNGNMISDLNKGIGTSTLPGIKYNHLSLPTEVKFNNSTSQIIEYTYDATGVKLKKEIPGKVTEYAGNFVYEKIGTGANELQFFNHPEGYVSYDGGQFNYVYNYLDHLGNVRLSYTDANQNNIDPVDLRIVQEKNYYPFGLTHRGYNTGGSPLGNDAAKRYGFGGKELQSESISGNILDWYDVSARNYDPALGRWMNLDPLAEQMRRHSPYNYAFNNPMRFTDPDGMAPADIVIWYKNEQGKNAKFVYTGNNLHEAPKNNFVSSVLGASFYNTSNGGGDNIRAAAEDRKNVYEIIETKEERGTSYEAEGREIIAWNPTLGLEVENGDILSPATILEHEFDHKRSKTLNPEEHKSRKGKKVDNYTHAEEKRVIQGSETKTAKANGEISKTKAQSRFSHGGDHVNFVKVKNETSTEKKEDND